MNKTFQLGDTVKIANLDSSDDFIWVGTKGHVGKITKIDAGEGNASHLTFYELEPYCIGRCWPAECLEMVKPAKVKTLFDIDDL